MSLLQSLSASKLRSTPKREEKYEAISHANLVAHEAELNRRMRETDLDTWYGALEDVTYRSTFLPISISEAEAMHRVHIAHSKGLEPTAADLSILDALEQRIGEKMKTLGCDAVFAKLSSRSPKDATNRVPIKLQLLEEFLVAKSQKVGGRPLTPNEILSEVFQAHISSFKLYSAKEVLETLISSDRVANDEIPLVLEHKNTIWKEHIVLREWVDVPIQFEFRGFVFENRLTALCQYYDEVMYPDLISNKDAILSLILEFFENVKDRVPVTPKEFVIDFLVELSAKRVKIVELNPFGLPDGMGTGTVMFDLKKKSDFDVIFGRAPFEFRIEMEPLSMDKYKGMLAPEYKKIVQKFEES